MFTIVLLDYLSYLPLLFVFVFVSVFIGSFAITGIELKNKHFLSFPLGLLILVSVFAIYSVNGKSIFILLIPFFFFYLTKFKSNKFKLKEYFKLTWKNFKFLLLPLLVFYTANYVISLKLSIFPYFEVCRDDMYYARLSTFIIENQIESYNIGWYKEIQNLGNSQYHFFEIYLNGLLWKVSNLKSLNTYAFYITPLVQLTYFSGLHFFNKHIVEKSNRFTYFFILILTLMTPAAKVTITFLPFILLVYSIQKQNVILTLFSSLLLFLLNPIFAFLLPPLFLSYLIYLKLIKNTITKYHYFSCLLVFATVIVYFMVGNIFKGKIENLNGGMINIGYLITYYSDLSHLKMLIHFAFNYSIDIFTKLPFLSVLISTIILLNLKNLKNFKSNLIFILGWTLIISLTASSILHYLRESSQIFQFTLFIFIFILTPFLFFKSNKYLNVFIYLWLIGSAINLSQNLNINDYGDYNERLASYSKSYINAIEKQTKHEQSVKVIRFLNKSQYDDTEKLTPYNSFEGYYLSFFKNDFYFHTFNLKNIPDKPSLNNFYNYNKQLLLPKVYDYNYFKKFKSMSDNDLLIQFLEDHSDVKYALIQSDAKYPEILNSLIIRKIVDSKSGEMFLILK